MEVNPGQYRLTLFTYIRFLDSMCHITFYEWWTRMSKKMVSIFLASTSLEKLQKAMSTLLRIAGLEPRTEPSTFRKRITSDNYATVKFRVTSLDVLQIQRERNILARDKRWSRQSRIVCPKEGKTVSHLESQVSYRDVSRSYIFDDDDNDNNNNNNAEVTSLDSRWPFVT
jgi:hypothetical protein